MLPLPLTEPRIGRLTLSLSWGEIIGQVDAIKNTCEDLTAAIIATDELARKGDMQAQLVLGSPAQNAVHAKNIVTLFAAVHVACNEQRQAVNAAYQAVDQWIAHLSK